MFFFISVNNAYQQILVSLSLVIELLLHFADECILLLFLRAHLNPEAMCPTLR